MTTRKEFIAAGAALGALAPQIALATATPPPAATPLPMPHLVFDVPAFDTLLRRPAKHRHLFASKANASGAVLDSMRTVATAYRDIGTGFGDVYPVAVLYHFALVLGLDDSIWNDLLVPNLSKLSPGLRDDLGTLKAGAGNPYLHKDPTDKSDASIEGLIADTQARLFLCNNALTGLANVLAKASGAEATATYLNLAKHLTPNTTIIPAGVWGVHAVQERGFTLLQVN